MRISDWSSDVCSSDLPKVPFGVGAGRRARNADGGGAQIVHGDPPSRAGLRRAGGAADGVEHGQDVFAESGRVLAHREMTLFLHDDGPRAGNRRGGPLRVLGRAGIVIFAGKKVERTDGGVEQRGEIAEVGILAVEVKVDAEHAGPALDRTSTRMTSSPS